MAPSLVAQELAAQRQLEVTVPDGPNAGVHRAMVVGALAWEVSIRAVTYRVCGQHGAALVVQGPSASTAALEVEANPFSAIFPGAAFGSRGDVVVMKA